MVRALFGEAGNPLLLTYLCESAADIMSNITYATNFAFFLFLIFGLLCMSVCYVCRFALISCYVSNYSCAVYNYSII